MTIQVDHLERQREIMRKTLHLIAERGYEDVTYQQIADVCGLSRTTLYKYYKNKREIFDCALLRLVADLGADFQKTLDLHPDLDSCAKIRLLCANVIDLMGPSLMQAITEYLIGLRRRGEPVSERLKRHTIGLHRQLTRLIREGIRKHEIKLVDPMQAAETMYALLESATMRLTLLESYNPQQFMDLLDIVLDGIRA